MSRHPSPLRLCPFSQAPLGDWPAYLAYLAAFFTTAAIWLSHHQTFTRLKRVDTRVLVLNIALLLGVALVPWPTVLLANALRDGNHEEQFAAVVVYAIVILLIGSAYTALGVYLSRHENLLHSPDHVRESAASHSLPSAALSSPAPASPSEPSPPSPHSCCTCSCRPHSSRLSSPLAAARRARRRCVAYAASPGSEGIAA